MVNPLDGLGNKQVLRVEWLKVESSYLDTLEVCIVVTILESNSSGKSVPHSNQKPKKETPQIQKRCYSWALDLMKQLSLSSTAVSMSFTIDAASLSSRAIQCQLDNTASHYLSTIVLFGSQSSRKSQDTNIKR